MNLILELLATLTAGLFCGAAIYINLVEHPARMSCGAAIAITAFAPSYKRATVMQVSLAAASFFSSLAAWLMSSGIHWLVGGIFIISVIPFTVVAERHGAWSQVTAKRNANQPNLLHINLSG